MAHHLDAEAARAQRPAVERSACDLSTLSGRGLPKLKSLALLLAEISVQPAATGKFTASIRRALAELVPATAMIGIFLMVAALSSGILPPVELLIIALSCAALLLLVLWRWFVRIHAKLQIALREIFERPPET